MLRVGLTGGLGSGKSTVAGILRELGAEVIESDELGRTLMEPGQPVYGEIVRAFGPDVVGADRRLNRAKLADLAFRGGRVKELNAIVHPAVIAAQRGWMQQVFARDRAAVAVVVSALIFEVERDARAHGLQESVLADLRRLDIIVVVTAPEEAKIARYVDRLGLSGVNRESAEADARARLSHQIPDAEKVGRSNYVIDNTGDMDSLRSQVERLWRRLKEQSNKLLQLESLE